MEIRSFCEERAMPTIVDERTIEGYAIVFEKESRLMFDPQKRRYFTEIIKRGAVTEDDLKTWDIKALAEHDSSRLLARSFNGVGTLKLTIDDYGLKYSFEAPKTTEGDNAVEMIRRKDLFGSSFAYKANEKENVSYRKKEDGVLLRKVKRLHRIFDISIVTDPAYFGTEVNVRSLDVFFDEPPKDESYKEDIAELRSLINNNF
ncbi:HK97 family phage prohead protease [Dysgonomonas sp. GY617]|uniref:HK97 family phage prohead protease n=1 Tax=Dysgonomonas sp. GY617 TaxID=2780420 RepID=UPI0018842E4F|nr:HK97 family phage prohead protease [Dysgonomonas sp. GY617]MBF0577733.1 HK97 family phage prohead protease [Dysgonomonas sp. GY617]